MQIFLKQPEFRQKFQPIFRTYKHTSHAENCFIHVRQFPKKPNFSLSEGIHRHSPQGNLRQTLIGKVFSKDLSLFFSIKLQTHIFSKHFTFPATAAFQTCGEEREKKDVCCNGVSIMRSTQRKQFLNCITGKSRTSFGGFSFLVCFHPVPTYRKVFVVIFRPSNFDCAFNSNNLKNRTQICF